MAHRLANNNKKRIQHRYRRSRRRHVRGIQITINKHHHYYPSDIEVLRRSPTGDCPAPVSPAQRRPPMDLPPSPTIPPTLLYCSQLPALVLQQWCPSARPHRCHRCQPSQKSSSVVKTNEENPSGLAMQPAITPDFWYSPTRHSKKLALPSRLIISIQSNGLRSK